MLLKQDAVMTLADAGKYILLEIPPETFVSPLFLLREIASAGIAPILTHPERCEFLSSNPGLVLPWVEGGVILQITAASLIGKFGQSAEKACWYWLTSGAVALVATDAHNTAGRQPCMSQAIAVISSRLGTEFARRVCLENPLRVLNGLSVDSNFLDLYHPPLF